MPDYLLHFRDATSVTGRESVYRDEGMAPPEAATGFDNSRPPFYRAKLQTEGGDRLLAAMEASLSRVRPDMDETTATIARAAIQEALSVIGSVGFSRMPWTGISDDGTVMLRWESEEKGVALSFSGEGVFALSKKTGPGDHYATDYKELDVKEGLPEGDIADIVRLS